jgi:hypothetical protein
MVELHSRPTLIYSVVLASRKGKTARVLSRKFCCRRRGAGQEFSEIPLKSIEVLIIPLGKRHVGMG